MNKYIKITNLRVILVNIVSLLLIALIITILATHKPGVYTPNEDFVYGSMDLNYGPSKLSVLKSEEVKRQEVIPTDGGLAKYPNPSNQITDDLELKEAILEENKQIMDFDELDKDGNLYKNGEKTGKKLIKHSSADSQYEGSISNNAKAYKKTLVINPYLHGNSITGLYVPAGEIVTIEIPKEYINSGLTASIGRGPSRGDVYNIPSDRTYSRMPITTNRLKLDKEINYVANPLGGPLYLYIEGVTNEFKVTITGAIEYTHFILGTTSKTELERLLKESEGLIFDLEVPGIIRLTMPTSQIEGLTANDLIDAAIYWEKFGSLSNYINGGSWYRTHVITHIYESYIHVGAAVAHVGRSFSLLPTSWGRDAVNMKSVVKDGSWGNLHEFNHHHQSLLGASGPGEVTNNVISILSYMEYLNVSSQRQFGKDIGGWNRYLDPSVALKELNKVSAHNTQLNMYVPIINSFGVDKFIEGFMKPTGNNQTYGNDSIFYRNMSETLGFDFYDYMTKLNYMKIEKEDLDYIKSKNLPMYTPVSTVYQVGQEQDIYDVEENKYERKDIKTLQPYNIDINTKSNITESIIVPNGFDFNIKEISKPKYGKVEVIDKNHIYTPSKAKNYEELRVTIELINGSVKTEQTLILGFGIQGETAKQEVTTILYSNPDNIVTLDNPLDYQKLVKKDETTTASGNVAFNGANNDVMVTKGQIVLPEKGKYTFYVAADDYAVMCAGKDRSKMTEVARIKNYLSDFNKEVEGSYLTFELEANESLYFELVVINKDGRMSSKIGYDNGDKITQLPYEHVYSFEGDLDFKDYFKPLGSYEYRFEEDIDVIVHNDNSVTNITSSDNIGASFDDLKVLVDGNDFNGYHSKVNNSVFPGSITIEYKDNQRFNTFEMYSLRNEGNPRGNPNDIVISISNDGINFTEIYKGNTKPITRNIIRFDKYYEAKYLKLEVLSSHRESYIGIGEIKLSSSFGNAKIFNAYNSGVKIKGKVNLVSDGLYVNGNALEAKKGTIKYKFKGNNIALYSTFGNEYGIMEVRVNKSDWVKVDLNSSETKYNQLAFTAFGLEKEVNEIEIRAKNKNLINIDYLVADNLDFNYNKAKFNFKMMFILVTPIVIINAGLITVLVLVNKKKKNK